MNHYCQICSVYIKDAKNMKRHYLSIRHKRCEEVFSGTNSKYVCSCGKIFTQASNLSRHRTKCNVDTLDIVHDNNNPEMVNTLIVQNNMMAKQIEELTKQVSSLLEKGTGNTNHTNNNHHSNNNSNNTNNIETQNVIVVNSFGHENTEYLTDQIVSKLIQNGPFTCLPKIIERIHFDPDHPENHNIKVTNQKNNYAKIIKDNKWITTNKKQAIDAMIQNGYGLLEEKYQDNKETIPEFKQERFEDFQEKYGEQDKDFMKNIKDQVDIAIINGSEQIHK